MKIGIDISRMHKGSLKRGIGFYTNYLINALKEYSENEIIVIDDDKKRDDLNIIHYPFFDLFKPTLPIHRKIPTVVTIHDVIPLVFPMHYPPGLKGKLNLLRQRLSLGNVSAIITDSECSKNDIESRLKISANKIFPIHLAPAKHFRKISDSQLLGKVRGKYSLPEKFVMYAGSVNWNKNLNNLAAACIEAQVDLVLAGKDFNNRDNLDHKELKSFREFLEKYVKNPRIHILGFLEKEDLVGLMNLAEALLLVSFYEGFGLTILEAQACQTPVITSNTSSMIEVARDSALLVDPNGVSQIKGAILKIFNNKNLKEQLIERGSENFKRFSWEKTAKETLEVYKKLLKGKNF